MHKLAKVVGRLLGLLIRNKIITVEEAFYIIEPLNEKIKKGE